MQTNTNSQLDLVACIRFVLACLAQASAYIDTMGKKIVIICKPPIYQPFCQNSHLKSSSRRLTDSGMVTTNFLFYS